MIEINFLPDELRSKIKPKRDSSLLGGGSVFFDPKYLFYIVPSVFALLICAHVYLGALIFIKAGQLKELNRKFQAMGPQRMELEEFNSQNSSASVGSLQPQRQLQGISWAQKLNLLSLSLPSGVWYNEISIRPGEFILSGSVVALQKEEMTLINKLISNLKGNAEFFGDFTGLELNSVQKRAVGSYDIFDFVLEGGLKSK